jgi:hypothetical protein
MDPVDSGLDRLHTGGSRANLDHLERDVLARINGEARVDVFRGRLIPVQLAVSAAALLIGLFMAEFLTAPAATISSEAIVLSDDIAPSLLLRGGGA